MRSHLRRGEKEKSSYAVQAQAIYTVQRKAYYTAKALGNDTELISDVGVAGIHRLLDKAEKFENAKAVGYGIKKEKTEFEDLARIADEKGISIFEAKQEMCKD